MVENVLTYVMPFAFALLPGSMNTPEARAALLAIGLQESEFVYRRQQGNGPARGFWQFERGGGVRGVLEHPATSLHAKHVCAELRYPARPDDCHAALADNDVLACCFARLLLWTLPGMLAPRENPERGWQQYLAGWQPGKPRHEAWAQNWIRGWEMVA